jgi:putative ABC transport system substrate-binding protein
VLTSLAGVLAWPLIAEAQPAAPTYTIGVLSADSRETAAAPRFLARELGQLGYVEGQNLRIEWRFADGNAGRLPELAADLVRLKVAVILPAFMAEILAVKQVIE